MRQVPPAFPIEATVAVNPWLGQAGEDRMIAAARLARVGGGRMFPPRESVSAMIDAGDVTAQDLAAAAVHHGIDADRLTRAARSSAPTATPLATVADLAVAESGLDWSALIEERIGLWAASLFDRGQAFRSAPQAAAWTSWRAFASRDLTPGLAGLSGLSARINATPTDPRAAFAEACEVLGLTTVEAPLYFHRLLVTLSGWAQYARHLGWVAERDGARDETLFDLLMVRLSWEVALLESGGGSLAAAWEAVRRDYAVPVMPKAETELDAALQEAVDHSAERRLAETLSREGSPPPEGRPALQAAFCIDVRSEILRRALEACDPHLRTIGFAGFFGLPLRHRGHASDLVEARAPILLSPALETRNEGPDAADRVRLRTKRAWGRFKRATVSAFAFVEAAGPLYMGKLLRDGLGLRAASASEPLPQLDLPLSTCIEAAAGILRTMSLTEGFARLVLICGHGASVTNMPQASALQCGACGGHVGDLNARLLAALLNDFQVREGLAGKGLEVSADTRFVAGLHDTVSDDVRLFEDRLPESHARDLER